MLAFDIPIVNEEFYADAVSPAQLDALLAAGWRHFDTHFFRYNIAIHELDIRVVIPLRIRLSDFSFSKNQRRILKRNSDLTVIVRPFEITDESDGLFHLHKERFTNSVPDSISQFLPHSRSVSPTDINEVAVFDDGRLVAVSYFDIGAAAVSGIYAIFEPTLEKRSLGIFTLIKEIEFAIGAGKEFYYLGYTYEGESFYDYKKRFRGSEAFDWRGSWSEYALRKRIQARPVSNLLDPSSHY